MRQPISFASLTVPACLASSPPVSLPLLLAAGYLLLIPAFILTWR